MSDYETRVIEATADVFGTTIRAGDLILHCVTSGRSAVLTCSRVREVRQKRMGRWTSDGQVWEWRTVLATEKPSSGRKSEVGYLNRVIRCPDGWEPPKDDRLW